MLIIIIGLVEVMKISKRFYYYFGFVCLAVIYVTASLLAPLGPTRFKITPSKTHVLQLTILLPVVIIWTVAIYGAERFKSYTDRIKHDKDGAALGKISTGFLILIFGIIFNGLFGILRSWAAKDGWLSAFTIGSNFLSAVFPLIAYSFMFAGSNQLRKLTKERSQNQLASIALAGVLLAIGVIYVIVLVNYKYANSTPDHTRYSSFYMSDPLIILTLAVPYLIGWGLALKTALNLDQYRKAVKGVIYRAALLKLVIGIYIIVAFYIFVQLLVAFSTYLATAGLSSILAIFYLLVVSYGVGFIVMALGAKKLTQIEDIH